MSCVATAVAAETQPVDIYVIMDQSVSMDEPLDGVSGPRRWDGVRAALSSFVDSPGAQDIRIGINYFGDTRPPYDCNAQDYFTPEVAIGPLPDVAQAIKDSINSREPLGFTPTFPALDGGIQFAQQHRLDNPGRATIVLLVTDGLPFSQAPDPSTGETVGCDDSVVSIAQLAEAGVTSPQQIRTFVIGISAGVSNLEAIASAGGGQAFIIGEGDLETQFAEALLNIVAAPIACDLAVPDAPSSDQVIDPEFVAVSFTSAATNTRAEIPKLQTSTDCGIVRNGQGWFFDDPITPSMISLCPSTCQGLGAGAVNVELGCAPVLGIQ